MELLITVVEDMPMVQPTIPKFARRKLLLAFLHHAGGRVQKNAFHFLLFLFHRDERLEQYSFSPSFSGCISFLADDDVDLLAKRGWILETEHELVLDSSVSPNLFLTPILNRKLAQFFASHDGKAVESLAAQIKASYPFYFLENSEKRETKDDEKDTLFTIGYEGISL